MKKTHLIMLSTMLFSTGCASNTALEMTAEEKIQGKWNCEYSLDNEDISINLITEDTYIRNGRANSFGDLKFKVPQVPNEELHYSVSGTADWKIQGKYLVMTMDEVKIVNLSHIALDDVLPLQDMFPENVSESLEIIELSETKLVLRSESDNRISQCSR